MKESPNSETVDDANARNDDVLKIIVSGGQTGVDRAALDAALEGNFPCGGWCPQGRVDEDGVIPDHYPLKELKKGGYHQRTLQNIIDSDGTLIIYDGDLEGGTEQTLFRCIKQRKPYKLIEARGTSPELAIDLVRDFVRDRNIGTLNVAGPRASKWTGGYGYTLEVIAGLVEKGK